ncbi:hypothetical protein CKA32_000923 [Geitlerinema sp. FC II]|nr:hypothetical protein CKA32_000923 [Geitlerinema sp. FC II]
MIYFKVLSVLFIAFLIKLINKPKVTNKQNCLKLFCLFFVLIV